MIDRALFEGIIAHDPSLADALREVCAALARETFELMRVYGIPATGANYQVWLNYRVAPSPALKEASRLPERSRGATKSVTAVSDISR